jgi:hypothetical protein
MDAVHSERPPWNAGQTFRFHPAASGDFEERSGTSPKQCVATQSKELFNPKIETVVHHNKQVELNQGEGEGGKRSVAGF